MKKVPANTQIRLLIILGAIAYGLFILQQRYNIFEVDSEKVEKEYSKEVTEVRVINSRGEQFKVDAEVVRSQDEKAKGLSNRNSLKTNSGMLFYYENDTLNGFWMKDTLIPLDMLFLSEKGEIIYIEENAQPCTEPPCRVYNPGKVYRYVLEVNGNWTKERNVKVGDTVDIPGTTSDSSRFEPF